MVIMKSVVIGVVSGAVLVQAAPAPSEEGQHRPVEFHKFDVSSIARHSLEVSISAEMGPGFVLTSQAPASALEAVVTRNGELHALPYPVLTEWPRVTARRS